MSEATTTHTTTRTATMTERRSTSAADDGSGDRAGDHRPHAATSAKDAHGFRHWRRQRPFIGGILVVLGGIELFFSGQLDTGNLHIQLGIEGLQATVIPIALVALGIIAIAMPAHHVFYGIIALVVAIYSLVGVNLGGFVLGMLLATVGAILVVAWMGPKAATTSTAGAADTTGAAAADAPSDGEGIS